MRNHLLSPRKKIGIGVLTALCFFCLLLIENKSLSGKNDAGENKAGEEPINGNELEAEDLLQSWQYDSALHKFNLALEDYEKANNWAGVVRIKAKTASAMRHYAKDYAAAMKTLNEGLKIADARLRPISAERAWCFHQKAHTFSGLNKPDSAIFMYNTSLKIADELPVESNAKGDLICDNVYWLGSVNFSHSRFGQAIEIARPRLAYIVSAFGTESIQAARLFYLVGASYGRLNDVVNAREFLECARDIYKATSGEKSFGSYSTYATLGNVYQKLGRFDEALNCGRRSREIMVELRGEQHPYVIDAWQDIAGIYMKAGQYERARLALESAASLIELTQMTVGEKDYMRAVYLFDYADLLSLTGQHRAAIDSLQEMILTCRGILEKGDILFAIAFNKMAESWRSLGLCKAAATCYQSAISELGIKDSMALALGELPSSIYYDQFLAPILLGKADALECLSENMASDIPRLDSALKAYQLAFRLIERSRRGFKSSRFKNELAARAHEAYERALRLCGRLHKLSNESRYLDLAFEFLEQSKSISHWESLVDAQAKKIGDIPDSILKQERRLQLLVYQTEERLIKNKQAPEASDLERLLFDSKRTYESFVDELKIRYPKYHALKYRKATAAIDQVRRYLLGPDRALVEYFLSDTTLAVFAIARDTLMFEVATVDSNFTATIHELRHAILDRDYEHYVKLALEVYQIVLAPYADIIYAKELIVVPDGELSLLPFEALLRRPPPNLNRDFSELDYVIYEQNISYGITATLLVDAVSTGRSFADFGKLAGFAPSFMIN